MNMRVYKLWRSISLICMLVASTLITVMLLRVPSVYGQERKFDIETGVTVDVLGTVQAFWGLLKGEVSLKQAVVKSDIRGYVKGDIDLRTNQEFDFGLKYSFSNLLKGADSLGKNILNGIDLTANYHKTWQTSLGDISSSTHFQYKPIELKLSITESVTSTIGKSSIVDELFRVDLSKKAFTFDFLPQDKKLLKEFGIEMFGNPSNPEKPETFSGQTSGNVSSSATLDGLRNGSGGESHTLNSTDATRLDSVGNCTAWLNQGVGGTVAPIDKLGLSAPYVGLVSIVLIATVAVAFYVKRVKHRKEMQ